MDPHKNLNNIYINLWKRTCYIGQLGRGSNYDLHIKIYKYFIQIFKFMPCQGSLKTANKGNQSQIIMRKKALKMLFFYCMIEKMRGFTVNL